ncbi:hypothetical protein QA601_05605 [Chitinispirillales bacterium ANBcel5]|uniref:hypothetical protein n=1 Tax=Cellulosispirillum alkaliphilum TaxID=3039283 RepID=UPI002A5060AF|nr:hypothetical protein [Chitinispirillales bacterium ANBcel5]
MSGKHCKLFDENLVHNIMLATGLSILDYLRDNGTADSDEVCEFIEMNATAIIEETIMDLNKENESPENDADDEEWKNSGENDNDL